MNSESFSKPVQRLVRALLASIGLLLVAYAVSDHPFYGGPSGFGRVQLFMAALGSAIGLSALLPGNVTIRILVFTLTSLIMLAVAEVAGEIVLAPRHRPIFQYDERVIFKFTPNRQSVMTRSPANGGQTVHHRINSAGFRGAELRPRGEAIRIVVYGDSFIHAPYSPDDETFTVQLGARLASRIGAPVEAINAGVSSYGPDQIAIKMADELRLLGPDLVIVAIFVGNDYGDLLRNKIFRLSADGRLAPNRWKLDAGVREWLELNRRESIMVRAARNTLRRWRPSPELGMAHMTDMNFLLTEAESEYRGFVIEGNDVVTNTHADYYSADVSLTPDSPSARYRIALMQEVLRRIRETARAHDVPLLLLLIPHPLDVVDQYDWGSLDRRRFPAYDGRNQTSFVESMARNLGLPHLSLYPLYRSADARSLYFGGDDDHWNAAGQRMAAEAMADYLARHDLPRRRLPRDASSSNK